MATATLNSTGSTTPPYGFATLTESPENSFQIQFFSNDLSIAG
jgi:hypothetical protein